MDLVTQIHLPEIQDLVVVEEVLLDLTLVVLLLLQEQPTLEEVVEAEWQLVPLKVLVQLVVQV